MREQLIVREEMIRILTGQCRFPEAKVLEMVDAKGLTARMIAVDRLVGRKFCRNLDIIEKLFTCWGEPYDPRSPVYRLLQILLERTPPAEQKTGR